MRAQPRLILFLLIVAALALGGCATPANVANMTSMASASEVAGNQSAVKEQVVLSNVIGGEETNPLWTSEIDNESYAKAVRDSLRLAGLGAPLDGTGEYQLDVHLVSVDQPMFGISMTVTVVAEYKLYRTSDRALVWSDKYTTPFTAEFKDAALGMERLRLANEGSARANIKKLIDALLHLEARDIGAT